MKPLAVLCMQIFVLLSSFSCSMQANYTSIFSFGNSYTDTGNLVILYGGPATPHTRCMDSEAAVRDDLLRAPHRPRLRREIGDRLHRQAPLLSPSCKHTWFKTTGLAGAVRLARRELRGGRRHGAGAGLLRGQPV
jgi:hypothetical protein